MIQHRICLLDDDNNLEVDFDTQHAVLIEIVVC